ncbi:glutathione S-transferase N-terminal domain-containing protein [Methylocapsa sp. S129]|uniref:glutathione S-transferase N-terminal domain-containing protein n=1 Tax=Methylocapsa sp. S129 TaxID=1641869 RepID=UPI00131C27D6|nr:glutathione S-transferase N-terminal domain-containing protein [Methylocapsa sp. S129]
MLVLRSSPASPFGRKVKIAAAILGLTERIEIVPADTNDAHDSLRLQNPLGKIPALVLEDGAVLYDSAVILEYLDWLAGGGQIIPAAPGPRFSALTRQALADGIADAALLQVYETRFREPGQHVAKWLDHQSGKVERGLKALEAAPPETAARDVGAIALACALGYLDLRFAGRWRAGYPRLAAWLAAFAAAVPAFEETRFSPPA